MARARSLLLALALAPLVACPEPVGQHAPPPPGPALATAKAGPGGVDALSLRRPAGPEWFGLYLMGKKAGWTRMELKREPRDGREVVVATSETLLEATVGDKTVSRRLAEERIYEARPAGRLLSRRHGELAPGHLLRAGGGEDQQVAGALRPAVGAAQDRVPQPGAAGGAHRLAERLAGYAVVEEEPLEWPDRGGHRLGARRGRVPEDQRAAQEDPLRAGGERQGQEECAGQGHAVPRPPGEGGWWVLEIITSPTMSASPVRP